MNAAAKTVYYFAGYLFIVGATLVLAPNILLEMFGFEPTSEVWIRVVGALALIIGVYYYRMAPTNNRRFLETTVIGRTAIVLFFLAFVALGLSKPALLLFGGIDLLGALWTWQALKKTVS